MAYRSSLRRKDGGCILQASAHQIDSLETQAQRSFKLNLMASVIAGFKPLRGKLQRRNDTAKQIPTELSLADFVQRRKATEIPKKTPPTRTIKSILQKWMQPSPTTIISKEETIEMTVLEFESPHKFSVKELAAKKAEIHEMGPTWTANFDWCRRTRALPDQRSLEQEMQSKDQFKLIRFTLEKKLSDLSSDHPIHDSIMFCNRVKEVKEKFDTLRTTAKELIDAAPSLGSGLAEVICDVIGTIKYFEAMWCVIVGSRKGDNWRQALEFLICDMRRELNDTLDQLRWSMRIRNIVTPTLQRRSRRCEERDRRSIKEDHGRSLTHS